MHRYHTTIFQGQIPEQRCVWYLFGSVIYPKNLGSRKSIEKIGMLITALENYRLCLLKNVLSFMTSFFVHILVKEDKIIGMKSYEALDKGQMPNYIKLYIKVL